MTWRGLERPPALVDRHNVHPPAPCQVSGGRHSYGHIGGGERNALRAETGVRRRDGYVISMWSVCRVARAQGLGPVSLRLTKNRTLTPLTAKGHRLVGQPLRNKLTRNRVQDCVLVALFFDRRPKAGASVGRDPVRKRSRQKHAGIPGSRSPPQVPDHRSHQDSDGGSAGSARAAGARLHDRCRTRTRRTSARGLQPEHERSLFCARP